MLDQDNTSSLCQPIQNSFKDIHLWREKMNSNNGIQPKTIFNQNKCLHI